MHRILLALHVALGVTAVCPVYTPLYCESTYRNHVLNLCTEHSGCHQTPLYEVSRLLEGRYYLRSVAAAGLPAVLALLNLPLMARLKGESSARWKAFSSVVLGLLSTSILAQLLARYGEGREWGAWTIWFLSLLLTIAGTVAVARLRPPAAEASQPT